MPVHYVEQLLVPFLTRRQTVAEGKAERDEEAEDGK